MNSKFLAMASMYASMTSIMPDIETSYSPNVYSKSPLTKKQKKARAKSKLARKQRRIK